MRRFGKKAFARLWIVAIAIVAVAAASFVAAPQKALAIDESPLVNGYYGMPFDDFQKQPGFEWVAPEGDEPGYYLITNPVPANPQSHEAVSGWWHFVQYSRTHTFDGYLIRLGEDLDFSGYDCSRSGDRTQLTVGSEDMKFSGTFTGEYNGEVHTLKNLQNERDGLDVVPDCGFFGQTFDAVIKNVNFFNCYVGSSFRGGVVAGLAQDTFLINISCENCTLSVVPGNNVINLITNAGLVGGMIAGETNGSTLYNCEMVAGRVVCNATAGLAALGGQPLYLGALVGGANDTTIEYSRVRDGYALDDNGNKTETREFASVRNRYDSAVSVANYSEIFTGGIVGMMQGEDTGSKVVDCYSTADVESYAAIRFAVGLGLGVTRGYTGGIAGIVREGGDGQNLIQRVSYAGNLHSYNYNVILLGIPAIEHDKYMGAITGRGGNNATIDQAYFMRHQNDQGFGSSTTEEFYAVKTTYGGGNMDGTGYGEADESYTDREEFWEEKGFDFAGGQLRNAGYDFTTLVDPDWQYDHYNKWVMDYSRGIPVHGGSIKATMDFPGSGEVTIGTTTLAPEGSEQTTDDPYDFAVQGYMSGDESITVTYTQNTTDKNESWAADDVAAGGNNNGFRFMGWYANRDVLVNDLPNNHGLFTSPNATLNTTGTGLIAEGSKYAIEGETEQVLELTEPTDITAQSQTQYEDNDLYVAYVQAQVLLHDVNGAVINKGGTTNDATNLEDDWYDYEGTLRLPTSVPSDNGSGAVTGNAKLVGWTTRPADGKGYAAISNEALTQLKNDGVFWETGATFTVTEPVNLYPVYTDLVSNAIVIYEGYENDDPAVVTDRDGYGRVDAKQDDNGVYIEMTPEQEGKVGSREAVFLGWYECVELTSTDEFSPDAPGNEIRVSADEKWYVPADKLTSPHVYVARFEYRVQYYDEADGDLYATEWMRYHEAFIDLDGPKVPDSDSALMHGELFDKWHTGVNHNDPVGELQHTDSLIPNGADWYVEYPMDVHAHWKKKDGGPDNEKMTFSTDFPNASTMTYTVDQHEAWITANVKASATAKDGYHLYGWTSDGNESWARTYTSTDGTTSSWEESAWTGSDHYWHETHLSAEVNYLMPEGTSETVLRRYLEPIALKSGVEHESTISSTDEFSIHYHFAAHQSTDTQLKATSAASPTDASMERTGFIFLGWIDINDLRDGSDGYEFNQIFDGDLVVANGTIKSVTDASVAKPYLMDGSELCYETTDLYPVYLEIPEFQLETSTNIHVAGVDTNTYHVPDDPSVADGGIVDEFGKTTVNYNKDGGTVLGGVEAATLSYDIHGEAQLTLTVDTDTDLWKNPPAGEESQKYTFVSVSVFIDGAEVETIPASALEDGMLSYVIDGSHSYDFRANYSPVPVLVTYHLNMGESDTEVYNCEVGNLLPRPSGTPTFSVSESAYFVGWTVDNDGSDYVEWQDGIVLANPGTDTVTATTHLWPVYRTGNVSVDSNIDTRVGESHRYTERRGEDIYLVAENVAGYRFDGWYTDYQNDENKGTSVTNAQEYAVTGDARFSGTLYTAVYTDLSTVPQVQYYDTRGNVIYTAYAEGDDIDRTFYKTINVDVPVYDEDGNQIDTDRVQQSVIIDVEAFSEIASRLMTLNETDGATSYQEFLTWQWVDPEDVNKGEQPQRWGASTNTNNFVAQKVADNDGDDNVMHLYPVTVSLEATSPSTDGDTTESYTGNLRTQLTMSDDGSTLESANITLLGSYDRAWLKVHLSELAYDEGKTENPDEKDLTDIPVTLKSATGVELDTDTTRSATETDVETGQQLEPGDAIFSFGGRIQVTKRTQDARAAGQVFTFTLTDAFGETRSTSVTVGTEPVNGYYTGTTTLEVPFGTYTVSEDTDWAWRYDATVETWVSDADGETDGNQPGWLEEGVVVVTYGARSQNNPDGLTSLVRATNTPDENLGDKWFDGNSSKHNVFGKVGV